MSVQAEHFVKNQPDALSHSPIVAAVSPQESRWFLESLTPVAHEKFGFRFLDLATRGWNHSVDELRALNPEILITCWSSPLLPDEWLESPSCRLRYICHLTGSVRHVISRRFIDRGRLVTNWGNIPSGAVAEHALLLALAALRNQPRWREVFERGGTISNHMEELRVSTLFGRRVGIHGFGQVAQSLVRLLAPFGVAIVAYAPGVPDELFARAGVRRVADLKKLFSSSDVLFECEALTASTRNAIGAAELSALPDDAVLVNVARAGLIDDAALMREATSRRLRIALDVFATEPLPPDSPWLSIPGAVLSPHMAGPTFDQYPACALAALSNIHRYLLCRPLEHLVTSDIYDRST